MRRALVLLSFAACWLWTPAWAQDAAVETCSWETAQVATVEQVAANYLDWNGKCVRIRTLHAYGQYATNNRLLADRLAVLENDEPRQRSLVINYRVETEHEAHRPRWEEVLGTVGSCKIAFDNFMALMRENPDKLYFMGGLCHYTLDHYLLPVAFRDADGPSTSRLRRSEIAPNQVQLLELSPSHVAFSAHRDTGERMFAALERRDFNSFLALENPSLVADLARRGVDGVSSAQRERRAAIREQFRAAVASYEASGIDRGARRILLAERAVDEEQEDGVELLEGQDQTVAAYWCRLREGADSNDLPVRPEDIDGDPSRPYFCVWTGEYVIFRSGTAPSASVPLFEHGFREQPD